jgi:hypothetical protein
MQNFRQKIGEIFLFYGKAGFFVSFFKIDCEALKSLGNGQWLFLQRRVTDGNKIFTQIMFNYEKSYILEQKCVLCEKVGNSEKSSETLKI